MLLDLDELNELDDFELELDDRELLLFELELDDLELDLEELDDLELDLDELLDFDELLEDRLDELLLNIAILSHPEWILRSSNLITHAG